MERKISFVQALKLFWKNYINFKGRSRRSEYWYMILWHIIFMIPAMILFIVGLIMLISGISSYTGELTAVGGILLLVSFIYLVIYGLATFIPNWSLLIRRFHDTGRSMLIPLLYFCILIVSYFIITIINLVDPEYTNISSILTLMLTYLIYMIFGIYCLVICCLDSKRKTNKYGSSHKYGNHLPPSTTGNQKEDDYYENKLLD
ncbi:MAG TPA: DUF805 domain-containing protein [Staphylococcus sp.]|nr:DUF805 domain-containing protein [Staphylococcus sp.]